MLLGRNVISSWLLLTWLCSAKTLCPTFCTCRVDEKARRRISCTQGSMYDPIPTNEMDPSMEILEISAPKNSWNELSLGPLFQGFKSLQELYIWKSHLMQIGMHTFWGVPSLKVLSLRYNNISSVMDHNFRGLVNLVELHLDNNRITSVPAGAFKHLTELRILTLENNLIQELVPRMFVKLAKLQVLKISGNPFLELDPEAFKDIQELKVFECQRCTLRRINTQIYHLLPYLTHLDLSFNQVQFIDAEEFLDLHRLRSLKMEGNLLPVVLEKTFINQLHLRSLSFARNRLAKITNTAFLNLTNLVELDISYNKLSKLETVSFQPIAKTLQKLVVSGNKFGVPVLSVVLEVTAKLKELSIADLKLTDVPSGLPASLLKLNLSGNHLENMTIENLPQKLVALDISRNKFRGLEDHVIQRLLQLQEFDVFNNTWSCDECNIAPLHYRINQSIWFQNISCVTPTVLKGKKLAKLSYEDIPYCDDEDDDENFSAERNKMGLIIGAAGIGVFLLFCVAFVVFSCVRRHTQRRQVDEKEKRNVERKETVLEPTVIFASKSEITFKFPLDLTERKLSVSTIDEIKKENPLPNVPNGTASGI